jgi:uncharacterized phage-associated protein
MTYRAMDVAKTFFELAQKDGKTLTNMHLQKLVFFAHGFTWALLDRPLIIEETKAWDYGPVISPLYNKLKKFGSTAVEPNVFEDIEGINTNIDADSYAIVKKVWDVYGKYNARELSDISHRIGSPWHQVWNADDGKFAVIPSEFIRDYYLAQTKSKPAA